MSLRCYAMTDDIVSGYMTKYPLPAILFLMGSSRKLIRSLEIPKEPNLNPIQQMVHKISLPEPFWVAIFSKCPPSAILFLMNYSQKSIRSSEYPENHPIKFECEPFNGSNDFVPTSFFGSHLGKWPLMACCHKRSGKNCT